MIVPVSDFPAAKRSAGDSTPVIATVTYQVGQWVSYLFNQTFIQLSGLALGHKIDLLAQLACEVS